jgi:phosphoserine phosphatase RsbU/P
VHDSDPRAVLRTLDTVLRQEDGRRFCTVLFGLFTPTADGCTVALAGGGHPPALLLRADGTAEAQDLAGGQLVGVLPNAHFTACTVTLGPGDTLLFYTDGITEARVAADRSRYGDEALLEFAAALAPRGAADTVTAVRELLTGFGPGLDDDTAVLALGVPPVSRS